MPREQAAPSSGLRERLKRIAPLRAAVLAIRQRINRHRVPAWLIKGRERDSGQLLSLLFVGRPGSRNYFARLVFGDSVTEQRHVMLWKRSFPKYVRDSRRGHEIAIVHVDAQTDLAIEASMKSLGFRLPSWVGVEKDLDGAAEFARHSKQIKSDLWRIRKNRLGYRVTREPAEFDRFYHTMYLPYIQRAFGDRACLMTYSEMQSAIPNSELFLVTQDGQDIAGGILVYDASDRVRGWSLGVKNGDHHWVSQGALGAFVQLQTDYLHVRGYRSLHAGASRPFLNDGALGFKKNRGMVICDRTAQTFVLLPLRDCAGARAFLQNNPFIYDDDGALKGAVFVTGKLTAEVAARLHHDWYVRGLKTLDIFRLEVSGAEHIAIRKCGYVDSVGRLNTTA